MARGQRKTVEEKIAEKEEVILTLRTKLKSEQSELDALYKEKRDKDLEGINQLLASKPEDSRKEICPPGIGPLESEKMTIQKTKQ